MTSAAPIVTPAALADRALRLAAGLLLAALLVFAPLNFGSTRAGGATVIAAACAAATLLWAASRPGGGRSVRLPVVVVADLALLTLAALPWITGLAAPTPVAAFTQAHFSRVAARWPASLVWPAPAGPLVLTLALAASTLPLLDLARSRGWALAFALAITATATLIAGLALLQNYTHATGIYWRDDGRLPGNFSGTFYHHTAAGAYFNTAWPLAVALTWLAWDRAGPALLRWSLILAGLLAVILLLAAHGSHVSRLPQLLALLVAPFLLRSRPPRTLRRWIVPAATAAVVVVVLVAAAGRTAEIGARWRMLLAPAPLALLSAPPPAADWPALVRDDLFIPSAARPGLLADRGESWRTALRAIAARPVTGHGPGNWLGAASRHSADPFVRTFYLYLQFTHQDLLQFAVEWGVPAALAWWTLLAGAVVAVLRARAWSGPAHRSLAIAAACGLAAVLLQAQVDFPLQMPAIALNVIVLAALCRAGPAPAPIRP